jgi:hypothetical protein
LPEDDDEERLLLAEEASLESSEPTLSAPVDAFDPAEVASVDTSEPIFFRSSLVLLEHAGALTRRIAPMTLAAAMRRVLRRDVGAIAWPYPHVAEARQQEIAVTREKPPTWAMDHSGGSPVRWQLCVGASSSES